ncbi:MAG TPA: ATP-dependent zinc metalloprotease FtsH [Ornithinibacter sp.]|jgi:cell division protease FtsH|uniref:ATP-dependent zinc metalloprotease FtsH n=1 Tax=Ornithinibacter sp. TaxID=2862748 RepID=UPI001B3D6DE8|nr:ATP-dependent zinc metalloprotease FtsH [Ornithinibacter sp.]MBP6525836.1 ATP-dependent zinc metalloprotease FtsH [Dermatophilaceae bacterium]HQV81885.1 ATP-dependent zinc metalloprotease FtsH [Ornithinibacter sp.]HQW74220.1 ATP-dependent zinc metalloprotease FtsH [Ornithinibacter sp.]HRA25381.1 ATP-dependent zinc metalloprotease FtsH [Ornithinibacter sp.]
MDFKRIFKAPLFWVLAVVVVMLTVFSFDGDGGYTTITTAQAEKLIVDKKVDKAQMTTENVLTLDLRDGQTFSDEANNVSGATKVRAEFVDARAEQLVDSLRTNLPNGYNDKVESTSAFWTIFISFFPVLLLVGLFWFLMSQAQGGGSRVMQFGKSKAKLATKDTPKVTFADVAGADEAVEELHEIKEFLAEPAKFLAVGAKIPKGVLLYGPPGTGKTLLARAVAGEAGVPFYSISGSDFVEMFVGVGASRVRDLFEQAKANAPAIVFVDEIDAVGRHRGAGLGGGHDEREQTLNQLLVEMDGFDVKTNVILIAATNRPDILDPALLRPGRFDRQIAVEAPDMIGRHRILEVHSQGKPMASGVDLLAVARRTPGFTGADLANVLNEAALLTARGDKKLIDDEVLDEAIDRVIAGPQKRTRIMSAKERKITAYHEGGHALVAAAMNHTSPVTKVTILPRGRALGYTMVMPTDDKYSTTRNEILDQLAYALGGRVAEEIIFHDPTTGAANDIEKATGMARKMVTEYGMSERVGAIKLGQSQGEVFLGRDMGHQRDYSEQVAAVVDEEVRRLVDDAHDEAWHAVNDNRDILDRLVLDLLDKETLNAAELAEIFKDVRKRPVRDLWLSSEHRTLSDRPPVLTPAEQAALNGRSNGSGAPAGASVNPGDPGTEADIDAAARAGAPTQAEDTPPTQIIQVPDGGRVDS